MLLLFDHRGNISCVDEYLVLGELEVKLKDGFAGSNVVKDCSTLRFTDKVS